MGMKRNKVINGFKKKGFKIVEGSKHTKIQYQRSHSGKKPGINSVISRGSKFKTIENSYLEKIAKQCRLKGKKQLEDLIKCPMSQNDYNKLLNSANNSSSF